MPVSTERIEFDVDTTYKIDYNLTNLKKRFHLNQVGPCEKIAFNSPPSSIYASGVVHCDTANGSDSTGDGTYQHPFKTPLFSVNSVTSDKQYVAVNDGVSPVDLSAICSGITGEYPLGFFLGFVKGYSEALPDFYITYDLGYVPSDLNTIYVDADGDDSHAGTAAAPKLTPDGALAACAGAKTHIMIADSETYDMTACTLNGQCVGIYAKSGETPTLIPVKSAANTIATVTALSGTVSTDSVTFSSTAVLKNGHVVHAYIKSTTLYYKITSQDGAAVFSDETAIDTTGTASIPAVAKVNDTQFVIAWQTGQGIALSPYRGKYQIYTEIDSDPWTVTPLFQTLLKTSKPHEFYSASVTGIVLYDISCIVNSFGNIMIIYKRSTDGKIFYVVRDSDGGVVRAQTTTPFITNWGVGLLSDDSFVLAGHYGTTSWPWKIGFIMIDSDGVITRNMVHIKNTDTQAASIAVAVFKDDDFAIIHDNANLKWSIYNSAGEFKKSGYSNSGADDHYMSHSPVQVINGDMAVIVYYNSQDGGYYNKMAMISSDGTAYADNILLSNSTGTAAMMPCLGSDDTDAMYIVYKNSSGHLISAEITISLYWDFIRVTSAAEIRGITIDATDLPYLYRVVHSTAAFTRKWAEIKGATYENTYNGIFGLSLHATAAVNLTNNLIHDNSGGDYIENDTAVLQYNDYYRQSVGYCAAVSGAGAGIVVHHNDMVDSVGGLRLIDNDGTESISYNIMHNNDVNDIVADTAAPVTNSIMTGDSINITHTGEYDLVVENPLFLCDGKENADDTDHNVQNEFVGDFATSPAYWDINHSSDYKDTGCYDVRISNFDDSFSTYTFTKPRNGIDVKYTYTGAVSNKNSDGSSSSKYDGISEDTTVEHDGMLNAEYDKLFDALTINGDRNFIRWYGKPTTAPTTWIEATVFYEPFSGTAGNYKLNRTGKQKVKYSMSRKITI